MNSVLAVSRYLIPAFVTACCATGALAQQGPPDGLGVRVLNTPTVNIGNTPVPVTGSVTTSGSVSLAPGSSVTVNTSTGPVLVKSVNDGIQPVQAQGSCNTVSVGCGSGLIYTVPANKRLVIEYVSFTACGLPGLTAQAEILLTTVGGGGNNVAHALNVTPPLAAPGNSAIGCASGTPASTSSIGQIVRLYAETGSSVTFNGDRANGVTGNASFKWTFSGYLVDAP